MHHKSYKKYSSPFIYLRSESGVETTAATRGEQSTDSCGETIAATIGEHFTGESGGVACFSVSKEHTGDSFCSIDSLQTNQSKKHCTTSKLLQNLESTSIKTVASAGRLSSRKWNPWAEVRANSMSVAPESKHGSSSSILLIKKLETRA